MNQPKPKVPKEIQHAGVEAVNTASNELFEKWKPKTKLESVAKWVSKLIISLGIGITTNNINKQ